MDGESVTPFKAQAFRVTAHWALVVGWAVDKVSAARVLRCVVEWDNLIQDENPFPCRPGARRMRRPPPSALGMGELFTQFQK